MSGKSEAIINHIKTLPAGTKISVRNIAKELNVSESTAYKAIKHAEDIHLVETRNRAGTFRLDSEANENTRTVTIADEICRLGLEVLTGKEYTNVPIGRIIVADGSLEQFKTDLLGAGENVLCLIGDRIDVLFFAASHGANIIVTSGALPGEALLETAGVHNACVLSSSQDSSTILSLLRSDMSAKNDIFSTDLVNRWMRLPPYLYWDDMVADWISSYRSLLSLSFNSAVVDGDLRICGIIDPLKAMSASPSAKLKNLYTPGVVPFSADVSASMDEIAQQMISTESSIAYITKDDALCGVVTALDVLRYYQYYSKSLLSGRNVPVLNTISSVRSRSVFTVQSESNAQALFSLNDITVAAVMKHCSEHYGFEAPYYNGSFYASNSVPIGELMVSCEEKQVLPNGVILDIEVYNEENSYCRYVVSVIDSEIA